MQKQLHSLNLHLAFSPSNLTNNCLLSCLFITLSTNTAPNIAALAFVSFLHRHWNTIIFVMPFRRSIPSCGLRSFEHLDWIPNELRLQVLLHSAAVWRRSYYSPCAVTQSVNNHHELSTSWCLDNFLFTISPSLWKPVLISDPSQECYFYILSMLPLQTEMTQQRTSAFCISCSFSPGFHERKDEVVGQKRSVRYSEQTVHLDSKVGESGPKHCAFHGFCLLSCQACPYLTTSWWA